MAGADAGHYLLPVASMGRLAAAPRRRRTEVLAALLAGARVWVERDALSTAATAVPPPWHLSEMRRSGAAPAGDGICVAGTGGRQVWAMEIPALTGQAFLTVRVGERLLVCADRVGPGRRDRPQATGGGPGRRGRSSPLMPPLWAYRTRARKARPPHGRSSFRLAAQPPTEPRKGDILCPSTSHCLPHGRLYGLGCV
ncbi:MAG: hypothetical protein ACLRIS_13710 [Flavonifractor plautii]